MADKDSITTKFKVDISDLKSGINEANRQIRLANAEFKSASAGMDNWAKSSDGISAKLKQLKTLLEQQQSKLDSYREKVTRLETADKNYSISIEKVKASMQQLINQGISKTSDEYKKYQSTLTQLEKNQASNTKELDNARITMLNQQGTVNSLNKDIGKYEQSLKDLGKEQNKVENGTSQLNEGFTVLKGTISNLVSSAIQKGASFLKDFASDMIETAAEVKATNAQFEQTFGDMAGEAESAIKRVAKSTGILETRLTSTASGIYAFARSSGATVPEAMELMETALMASADSAAYYDKSLEDAAGTLQSFLKGNYANDAELGVSATEFTRNAKATELFGQKYNDLTEIQKQQTLLKMVTDSQKLSGAMGQAAREADGWENVQGNLNESWKQFQAHVGTPFLEALVPVIQKVTNNLSDMTDKVDWDEFGDKVEKGFDKALSGFEWIIKNKSQIINAIKLMIAAFAINKINSYGKSITNFTKNLKNQATETKLLTNVTKNMTATQKLSTIATNTGTIAWKSFGAAIKANPIGAAATAIMLTITAFKGLTEWVKNATKETDKNVIATNKLAENQKKLNKEISENAKSRKESIDNASEEAETAQILLSKLEELTGVENKSASEKTKIKEIVSQLNTLLPELNLNYDGEKDALNKSTDAIRSQIEATKELAKAKAAEAALTEIATEMVKIERERDELIRQNTKNENAYNNAVKERIEFESKYTKDQILMNKDLQEQQLKLIGNENKAKRTFEESKATLDENTKSMKKLNDEYDKTSDYASKMFDKADINKQLSELIETCKTAGIEIPEAIKSGIDDGMYAVPKSIEELNNLINFDDALKKIYPSGVEIPKSISQGILDGKISIEEAMNQISEVTSVANKAQDLIDEGKTIPKNLAEGIKNGSVSIEEANKIISDVANYDELSKKAAKAGATIPKDLADNIKNGKVTVESANNTLSDCISFKKTIDKAKKDGVTIPNDLANNIKNGIVNLQEANNILNSSINFNTAVEKARNDGYNIPNTLSNNIKNGTITVSEANSQLNNLINFTNALNTTTMAGATIPSMLRDKILEGKVNVDDGINQMNNWVRFEAALNTTDLAGYQIPEKLANNILSGKLKPQDAVKQLNSLIASEGSKTTALGEESGKNYNTGVERGLNNSQKRQGVRSAVESLGNNEVKGAFNRVLGINSPSKEGETSGGYFLDGIYNGVINRNKRNNIFNAISNFGTNLLNSLRTSLKEHSPSEATEEMGINLLAGIPIGIDERKKSVLNQVKKVGQSIVNTLNDQLDFELNPRFMDSLNGIKTNLTTSTNKIKTGLNNGINNINGTTSNVNNFTQNIYAPKQPSRIELYRQTRNLLNYVKKEV